MNTGALAGKTVFITGSSRGIGKAIALKVAKDGANVVVAAKTVEPHPKLEGTIYTAAKEIEAAGGHSLPIQLDLRDENQVKDAIDKTVEKFGGIDILVNNASAIFLAPSEDTPMKRWDLMNSINVRGTFMVSKYAIPHLKKASNAHILNLSPPIELKDRWFSTQTPYTMAKYGMSLSMFGMSAELKNQVAVNALWPKTAIWTAAMSMLGGETAKKGSRYPSIMADAAYSILSKDKHKSGTGNFFIDEEVLKSEGVTNFDKYALDPSSALWPDFFLPQHILKEFNEKDFEKIVESQLEANSGSKPADIEQDDSAAAKVFASASLAMTDDLKNEINAKLHFVISDQSWCLISKINEPFSVTKGEPEQCDVTLTTDEATFMRMARGETKPTSAFMMGKLKIKGNMQVALKAEKLFGKLKSKL